MKAIKIISIILAVLLAAGLAVALIVDSSRENEKQQHAAQLENELRPLRVELSRLQNERSLLDQEYTKSVRGMGTVALLYNGAYSAIYDAVCPGMEKLGFTGIIAVSPAAFPGDPGCITVERFRKLIADGWGWCVSFPINSDSPEQDVSALLERADSEGIARTTVIFFPEGSYSDERGKWASSLGFSVIIHHGELDLPLMVTESGDGVWYPGAVDWRSSLRRNYLASVSEERGHFVFEITFRSELFDTDAAYHDTLLEAMNEYETAGLVEIMNPEEARKYRSDLESGFDSETLAYRNKCDEIDGQIAIVRQKIDSLYADYSATPGDN